jgi:hypothetical protein
MVKCDEGHNIVVVVPSGSKTSHTFWTGAGEAGFSPLVCRMVQKIHAQGVSVLPLGEHENEMMQTVLARIPKGIGEDGLYVVEQTGKNGVEVLIFSFSGSRFNRLLTLLLQDRLGGKVQVRYNDFIVRVLRAGKENTGQRVMSALQEIQKMEKNKIRAVLPLPQAESWKFARALPASLLSDLSLSDHYHAEEFMDIMRNIPVFILNTQITGIHTQEQ